MDRRTRIILSSLLLPLLAVSVIVSMRKAAEQERIWKTARLESSPAYLHSERIQIAAAQASMDALAQATTQLRALYQPDYRIQRMQLQANWLGLEQLASNDPYRQGLLREIRSSIANLFVALDQTAASATPPSARDQARLKSTLQQAQTALGNYSGSLAQGAARDATHPVAGWFNSVWMSLILLLVICGALIVALEYLLSQREKERTQHRLKVQTSDSTEAMLLTCDTQGRILHANTAAKRGMRWPAEAPRDMLLRNILAPGEYDRLAQLAGLSAPDSPNPDSPDSPNPDSIDTSEAAPARQAQSGRTPGGLQWFRANHAEGSDDPDLRDDPELRDVELQFQRSDGSRFWALCAFSPLRNAALTVEGMVCAAIDISDRHEAAVALGKSEERHRNLCEHTQEMLAVLDHLGRYCYVNAAWLHCMNKTREQVLSSSFESVFPLEQQAAAAALLRKATHGQPTDQRTLLARNRDGGELELEVILAAEQQNGTVSTVYVAFRDVTDRNRRERRLAMQLEIGRTIATASSLETLLPELLRVFTTHLGADFADIWVVYGQPQQRLRCGCEYSRTSKADGSPFHSTMRDTLTMGEEIPGRILEEQRAIWIEDIASEHSLHERQRLTAEGIVSAWGVPIRGDNQLLATVQFYHRRKRRPDLALVAGVEQICRFLGLYMIRSEEQAEMQRILHQSNSILRSLADGIFVFDAGGRITFANASAARFFDLPQSMLLGRSLHMTAHPDIDHPCNGNCPLHQALQHTEASTDEDFFYRANGSEIPVRFSVTPCLEQKKVAGGVLSFHADPHRSADGPAAGSLITSLAEHFYSLLERVRGYLAC